MSNLESTQPRPYDGVRETLESIIVALILAFVFRAFVVEAFVIPTGSMAPTLYGAHGTILCNNCGVEFAYGLRDLSDHRQINPVRRDDPAYCPYCRYANMDLTVTDDRGNPESGDRILVLKWPYDLAGLGLGPKRWDVTVFKDPADGTTNFIKRLVGLPNEVLMILDGDVFAATMDTLSKETVDQLDRLRHEKYLFRIGRRQNRDHLSAVPEAVMNELTSKLRIVRKSEVAQKSLWQTVFDQDYPPTARDDRTPQWRALPDGTSGWQVKPTYLRFVDRGIAGDAVILSGGEIRASCAYNIHGNAPRPRPETAPFPPFVSDQRVRFVLTPLSAGGELGVTLQKNDRTFRARISMDGHVSVEETSARMPRHPVRLATQIRPFRVREPVHVSFAHADYKLVLRIHGTAVLTSTEQPGAPGYYSPDVSMIRSRRHQFPVRPRIDSFGGSLELSHVAVDRDVYYYQPARRRLALNWAPPAGWGSEESPIMLRGNEYFMLGDNTAASKDSRLWDVIGPHLADRGESCQLGAVPEDQLIGKAFFVYWPSMQRIDWLNWVPLFQRWGVVPDVGRMRLIR